MGKDKYDRQREIDRFLDAGDALFNAFPETRVKIEITGSDFEERPTPFIQPSAMAVLESVPDQLVDKLREIAGDFGAVTITITPKGHYDLDAPIPEATPSTDKVWQDADDAPRIDDEWLRNARRHHGGEQSAAATATIAKFALGSFVHPEMDPHTHGKVIALTHYLTGMEPNYLVRLPNKKGEQSEEWFTESAIVQSAERQDGDSDRPARPTR